MNAKLEAAGTRKFSRQLPTREHVVGVNSGLQSGTDLRKAFDARTALGEAADFRAVREEIALMHPDLLLVRLERQGLVAQAASLAYAQATEPVAGLGETGRGERRAHRGPHFPYWLALEGASPAPRQFRGVAQSDDVAQFGRTLWAISAVREAGILLRGRVRRLGS